MPLEEALQTRIFAPLGLDHTLLPARTSNTLPDEHARGYLYGTVVDFDATDGILPPEEAAAPSTAAFYPTT